MTAKAADVPDGVFARERQEQIARMVEENGRARVTDLAGRFGVSAVTIRKDLLVLASERRVVRIHGGAINARGTRPEFAFHVRERLQREEKSRMGAAAAASVADGEAPATMVATLRDMGIQVTELGQPGPADVAGRSSEVAS